MIVEKSKINNVNGFLMWFVNWVECIKSNIPNLLRPSFKRIIFRRKFGIEDSGILIFGKIGTNFEENLCC